MLLFVNRYFHPDHSATAQILSDLVFDLAAAGEDVVVVTSRQLYDDASVGLRAEETVRGVRIVRVWTSRFGRHAMLGRSVDYATFYVAAARAILAHARRGDVVVTKTDPPLLSVVVGAAARWRGARTVDWLQDVFPEAAAAIWPASSRASRLMHAAARRLRDRALRASSAIVVIGESMAHFIRQRGLAAERVHVIANWADGAIVRPVAPADNELRRAWGLERAFVVGYSGNLGRAHDFATFVAAAERLRETAPDLAVVWLFIGGGAQIGELRAMAQSRGLSNIMFQAYQPRDRLAESLSVPDVHLVTLQPDLEGLIVPSKFYGNAAAGRAQIFIGHPDGELARALRRTGGGLAVAQGDGDGLAAAVRALAGDPELVRRMGEANREAFLAAYDKPVAIAAWRALLAAVRA